ncbi:AAA family ATPase [Burkholderia sp. WSM2230]|uniref:AAA family ATPase n=1 Tax=Burkholderia sp. WSM2230 TaxID=944435 RepID=UPI0003F88569|nr:AAA family ATPase [Burkholderia sp. WSM2230]
MRTNVYMHNYRGFSDAWIPLRKVNFLVGENSTGKSSFLDLVNVFYEFQFWMLIPAFRVSNGAQKHFLDLVSAASSDKESFTIGAVDIGDRTGDAVDGLLVTYVNRDGRPVPSRVSVLDGDKLRTLVGGLSSDSKNEKIESRVVEHRWEDGITASIFLSRCAERHHDQTDFTEFTLAEDRRRMPFFMKFGDFFQEGENIGNSVSVPSIFAKNFVELAPIRSKPRRTYDAPQTEFSPEGDHIPYTLKKNLSHSNAKHKAEFKEFLKQVGESSGLFDNVTVNEFGTGQLAPFEVKVNFGDVALGLPSVGYGVSQALPVLVEAFVRPHEFAFAIQQPEVHLHPRAQAAFGDVVANLAKDEDKIFFVETHSDFTIDRFRINLRNRFEAIANSPQDTAVNLPADGGTADSLGEKLSLSSSNEDMDDGFAQIVFFERVQNGNHAVAIPILKDGRVSDDQPESYRDFFLHESLSLL